MSLNLVSLKMGGLGGVRRGGSKMARRMMKMTRTKMGMKKRRQQDRRREDVTEGLR